MRAENRVDDRADAVGLEWRRHRWPAPQGRLFGTGRNMQLNIKASADTVRRFIAISDAYEWPSGLTMEHAIGALERELARQNRPKGRDAPSPLAK